MFVFCSTFGLDFTQACSGTNKDALVQWERLPMPESFIQKFLDVFAFWGFGNRRANCLQVGAVVTVKTLIITIIILFFRSSCVFGHVGKIIQGLCHECGFFLVELEGNKRN